MREKATNHILSVFMALAFVMALASCKPSVPGEYIQPGKMADILYEYHLAEQLFNTQGGDSAVLLAYRDNIFKRYGVDSAEFDSSMVYYTRHTRLLYDIYEKLGDRFSDEVTAQGGSDATLEQYGMNVAGADTASVWRGDRSILLMPYALKNLYTFEVKADTSFHKGDRVMLDFDAQFLYQEGIRNAAAVVAVTYGNDSIASQTCQMASSSHYHLQIEDFNRLGIKSIRGYFLLGNDPNVGYSTTLRMVAIYNIRMLRMHVQPVPEPKVLPGVGPGGADSAAHRGPDSAKAVPAGVRNVTPPGGKLPQPQTGRQGERVQPTGITGLRPVPVAPVPSNRDIKTANKVKGKPMQINRLKPLEAHPVKK